MLTSIIKKGLYLLRSWKNSRFSAEADLTERNPIGPNYSYEFRFHANAEPSDSSGALVYEDFRVGPVGSILKCTDNSNTHAIPVEFLNPSNDLVLSLIETIKKSSSCARSIRSPLKSETVAFYINCNYAGEYEEIIGIDRVAISISKDIFDPVSPASYKKNLKIEYGGDTYLMGDVIDFIIESIENRKTINQTNSSGEKRKWWLRSSLIHVEYSIIWNSTTSQKYEFVGTVHLKRHIMGEVAMAAPIPPFPKISIPEDEYFKNSEHHVVVGSYNLDSVEANARYVQSISDTSFKNLDTLTKHIQFTNQQITWIMGDPGSGKEIFATAIHNGSIGSLGYTMQKRSVAGSDYSEFNRRLFTAEDKKPCLVQRAEHLRNGDNEEAIDDGDAYRSYVEDHENSLREAGRNKEFGGSIFLDEFDKIDDGNKIYSSMLRVLEAKEYVRREESSDKNTNPKDVPMKYGKLNWVFAGAFSQKDPAKSVPPDFWSRLTGYISIENPIKNDMNYAGTLFVFFYVGEALKTLSERHGEQVEQFVAAVSKYGDEMDFVETVFARTLGAPERRRKAAEDRANPDMDAPYAVSGKLLAAAAQFSKLVEVSPGINVRKIDSARAIRQAAMIAFFEMRARIIENADDGSYWDDKRFESLMEGALRLAKRSLGLSRGP